MLEKHILYLEICDPKINVLIWEITNIINSKEVDLIPAHLTLQGPYKRKINEKDIEKCKRIMQNEKLEIAEAGRFSNPNEEVIYLKVNNPKLRQIWRKPDFPIKKYNFNPHISLYRGEDKEWADLLVDFFNKERLNLVCEDYNFQSKVMKKRLLPQSPIDKNLSEYKTLLSRLKKLADRYQATRNVNSKLQITASE